MGNRPSVRQLFTFKSSSLKPLNRFQPNLPEMLIVPDLCFGADLKSNMAARVHNVFSLAEILKIFLSETTKSIEL